MGGDDVLSAPAERRRGLRRIVFLLCVACAVSLFLSTGRTERVDRRVLQQRRDLTAICNYVQRPAGPAFDFALRRESNRFEPGTPPTFIRNVRIWTGEDDGNEVIDGDVLVDKGMIRSVGRIPMSLLDDVQREWNGSLNSIDAGGAWMTPGLVDLHSHIGVGSAPSLRGAADTNSRKAPILPWLRSIDGLNTHDDSYALAMAGGVTTAQILPGSANNIGASPALPFIPVLIFLAQADNHS